MNEPEFSAPPPGGPVHDPEATAAAYLAGDYTPEGRAQFEEHLLGCEACWAEVRAARDGRAAAESLREPAPQAAREYLRTLAASGREAGAAAGPVGEAADRRLDSDANGRGRSRWPRRWSPAAAALVGAVLAAGITAELARSGDGADRETLAVAEQAFEEGPNVVDRVQPPPVPRLGTLTWQGTATRTLAGRPATVHRYGDVAGASVLLVSSTSQFPRAEHAATVLGSSWTAPIDGAVVFCVDHGGLSWLVIGKSREGAIAAGRAAGLA